MDTSLAAILRSSTNKMSLDQLQAVTPTSTGSATSHSFTRPRRILHRHVPDFSKALTNQSTQHRSITGRPTYGGTSSTNPRRNLSAAFVEENFNFYGHTLSGTEKLQPAGVAAVRAADRDLGEVLGQAYVAAPSRPKASSASSISSTTSNPPSIRTSSPSIGRPT